MRHCKITCLFLTIIITFEWFAIPVRGSDEDKAKQVLRNVWNMTTDDQRKGLPDEVFAAVMDMPTSDFQFFARCVEAESDRSDDITGKIYVAAVMWNRVNDSRFSNDIRSVLTQSGQFAVVVNGDCSVQSTQLSRWAIIEALRMITAGDIPDNLLYFNCIGYNCGTAYGCIGGNYFMCA